MPIKNCLLDAFLLTRGDKQFFVIGCTPCCVKLEKFDLWDVQMESDSASTAASLQMSDTRDEAHCDQPSTSTAASLQKSDEGGDSYLSKQ